MAILVFDPFNNKPKYLISGTGITLNETSGSTVVISSSGSGGGGTLTGSGLATQVAFWTNASTLSGNNGLVWDNTNTLLIPAHLAVTSGSMSLNGKIFTLDANIELDPTGAISGKVLGYNGSKWIPMTVSSGSGGSGGLSGSGTATQVGYFTSGSFITSDSGMTYYPGASPYLEIVTAAGYGDFGDYVGIVANYAAGNVGLTLQNTNNANAGADMIARITSGGSSGGDPYLTFNVGSTTSFSQGIDNSDSDKWKLEAGTNNVALGGGLTVLAFATNGDIYLGASNVANGGTSASLGSTSPGNGTPQEWLKVVVAGNTRYIPLF